MAVKYVHKVIIFNPSTVTDVQLQTALDNQGALGWEFVAAMQNTTSRAFALFRKALTQ